MDDTHDQLVKAYLEYFKANEKWETRRSMRTYYATQRWLRKIKALSKKKQEENTAIYKAKFGKDKNKST